jgi:hypothetical protein
MRLFCWQKIILTKINIYVWNSKKMLILPSNQYQFTPIKMKKIALSLMAVAFGLFVACGPSAEEKAAKEKAIQDSIARADSIAKAELEAAAAAQADSIARAEAEAAKADSIAKAEEAAKGKKK